MSSAVRPADLPLVVQVLAKVALAIAQREAAAQGKLASDVSPPIARRRRQRPAA